MSWRVTADPQRFNEAVEWFRGRVPLSHHEYQAITQEARRRAFTVAGVAQADVVADVWRALDRAIADGTGYRDFAKEVSGRLQNAWGKSDASRVQTIFQTNIQGAYAAGRYRQLTDQAVLRARPYWMFDAVLDERTTGLCRELNGAIRLHDDPFWDSRTPPLHFNCRSGLRSLTRSAAQRRGVTDNPLRAPPPPLVGFGARPAPGESTSMARGVMHDAITRNWQPAFAGGAPGPTDYGRPAEIPISPRPVELLPTVREAGEEAFRAALAQSWGGIPRQLRDPNGVAVNLDQAFLDHVTRRRDGRERFLSLLPDLIQDPYEVWLIPLKDADGRTLVFRQRYLKRYADTRDRNVVFVAEYQKGFVVDGYTIVESRYRDYLQLQRKGFLRYGK